MNKIDGRKMSHEALETIRKIAVQRVQEGESPEVVIRALGFDRRTIYRWLAAFHSGGVEALQAKPLFGRPRILEEKHMKWLYRVVQKDPRQLCFPFGLWTREMLAQALKRKFPFVEASRQTIGRALKILGITCQKPLHRAVQQNAEAVKVWLEQEFPAIKSAAQEQNADIFFGDEAGIRSDYHRGTTWGICGETPVVRTTGARFSVNMISAVSAKGQMRFMVVENTVTGPVFLTFLKRLMAGRERRTFLVLDRHPIHKSARVKKFVEETNGALQIFYLPSYSPELNPDELVWNCVKRDISRCASKTRAEMKGHTTEALRQLQRTPAKVKRLFHEEHVKYAAL